MSPSEGKDSDSSDSRKTPIIFIFLIVLYIFLHFFLPLTLFPPLLYLSIILTLRNPINLLSFFSLLFSFFKFNF